MHQNLSDDSSKPNSQSQLDVPYIGFRSWTDGDTAVHEHQAGESASPNLGHRKRVSRMELRGLEVREAVMAGVVVVVAIALFFGGIVVGIIAVVAVAVRREDRAYSLVGEAPGRMSRSARRLNGLGRRDLDAEFFRSARELVH